MHEPLTALPIGTAHPDLFRVRRLYESAFPANERRPFEALLSGFDGQGELLAFYLGGLLCGLCQPAQPGRHHPHSLLCHRGSPAQPGPWLRRAGMHQGPQAGPAADCRSGSPRSPTPPTARSAFAAGRFTSARASSLQAWATAGRGKATS